MQSLLLIALLAAAPGAAGQDFADDFADDTNPGLALGSVPPGSVVFSFDLGYLKSAIRAQVGLGRDFDLVLSGDAFLLHDGFGEQNGLHAGARFTPLHGGLFRMSLEGAVGLVFISGRIGTTNVVDFRGDLSFGLDVQPVGTVYGRVGIRGINDLDGGGSHWGRDEEVALGLERTFGRFVVGGEAWLWARPGLDSIPQWRLRVGYHND